MRKECIRFKLDIKLQQHLLKKNQKRNYAATLRLLYNYIEKETTLRQNKSLPSIDNRVLLKM